MRVSCPTHRLSDAQCRSRAAFSRPRSGPSLRCTCLRCSSESRLRSTYCCLWVALLYVVCLRCLQCRADAFHLLAFTETTGRRVRPNSSPSRPFRYFCPRRLQTFSQLSSSPLNRAVTCRQICANVYVRNVYTSNKQFIVQVRLHLLPLGLAGNRCLDQCAFIARSRPL
jgi:hypothetical protein